MTTTAPLPTPHTKRLPAKNNSISISSAFHRLRVGHGSCWDWNGPPPLPVSPRTHTHTHIHTPYRTQVLPLLPDDVPVADVLPWLEAALRFSQEARRGLAVRKQLRRCENLSAMEEAVRVRQQRVLVTGERACSICHKRLGGSVVVSYPGGLLAHYLCHKRHTGVSGGGAGAGGGGGEGAGSLTGSVSDFGGAAGAAAGAAASVVELQHSATGVRGISPAISSEALAAW